MSEFEEGAKAAGAIAETVGKGIDASREVGSFFGRVLGPAIEELGGHWHDRVKLYRAERLLNFKERFDRKIAALGYTAQPIPVSLKFGLPLLEAAAVEEDAVLSDMLATLLAQASSAADVGKQRRAFVSILQEMEPLDARVLVAAYNSPAANPRLYPIRTIYTAALPDGFTIDDGGANNKLVEPPPAVQLALWNLARLGCVEPAGLWDGAASIALVTVTYLGIGLIEAATLPSERSNAAG